MSWTVYLNNKAKKQLDKLPASIRNAMTFLVIDIEKFGPLRHNWKNFGKFKGSENLYHCHIKSGKPTYVACWEVVNKKIKITEVYYVGTHEKAPY